MKSKNVFFPSIFVMLFLGFAQGAAQPREQGFRLNGVVVTFLPTASDPATLEGITRSYGIDGNTISMSLINESTDMYISYRLKVERLDDTTKLKISVLPPTEEEIRHMNESVWLKKLKRNWPNKSNYGPAPLPRYPEPRIINISDKVELPLLINSQTGARISDVLRFEIDKPRPVRDFTLDDVALKLASFRLLINGETRSGDKPFGGFAGPLPWFAVPGKGRFILSIQPHEGYNFQKIGVIEDNAISFTFGGDNYEWISGGPVIDHGGKYHLWVLYDPNFEPGKQALDDISLFSEGNCCLYGTFVEPYQIGHAK
ncbi:MAG: hypothetical protein J2P21_07645 [Chloracidobacterium sp.]|nr:hypothetical protein [Chloracidobacterium sp.]